LRKSTDNTCAWEQRKLSDLAEIVGGGTPDTNNSAYWDGDIDWYAPAEMEGQRYATGSVRKITELGLQKSSAKILPAHRTVLFTSRAGIGKMAILQRPAATNQGFQSLVLKDGTDPYFIYSMGERIKGMAEGVASGSTFLEISGKMLGNLEVMVPNLKEQESIATFFRGIDDLITLHQRKYDKLVAIKRSMLEKMFPREGSRFPEIRFAGFTDPWEQRKLLDCIQKITDFRGRTPKKLGMDWSESGYLALSALNVKDGYIDFTQDVHYGDQALYDKWMIGNELHMGQVLFTTEAPMGNVAQVPDNRRYILSQRTIAFDVKPNLITENFLATVLKSPAVFAMLTALSSGGTAKGVSQKSLATVDIIIPSDLTEQEHLSATFSQLDTLITLHQRKLEKLQAIKRSMLEKMFV
jgi:type I restriction enzyme S subunit